MKGLGKFIIGVAMGLIGLLGLTIASRAADEAFYWTGLIFAAFGVLFIYGMLLRYAGADGEA